MAEQYKLLIQSTIDAPVRVFDVSKGAGAHGQALRVKAQPGQKIQLHALGQEQQSLEKTPEALLVPKKVKLKRVGVDLEILLDDFGEADIVVEDYYTCHVEAEQAPTATSAGADEDFRLQSLPFVTAASTLGEGAASSCLMMAAPAASPLAAAGLGGVQVAVVANDMDSKSQIQQTPSDPYQIILAEANGAAEDATPDSDPTAAQYQAIGADIGDAADAQHTNNLKLLNDLLGAQETTGVDTVAEINDLARIANAVQTLAAGATPSQTLTVEDFLKMGITGVSFGNIQQVLQAIAQTPDSGDDVNSLSKLQDLVSANSPYLEIVSSVTLGVVYQGITVVAYDDQGHEMGRSNLAANNTAHTITIDAQGWGQYHGAVLLKVLDANGDAQNYNDEASGADKNLTTSLRAASVADGSNKNYQVLDAKGDGRLTVDITPLTEMAVRLAERSGGTAFADKAPLIAAVQQANTTIANAFGLGDLDITGAAVVVNTPDFHAELPLTPSERYGLVLAELSGIDDLEDGSLENTIQVLFDSIKGEGQQAKLTVFGEALLEEGAIKVLENLGHANATADTPQNRNLFERIASLHKEDAVSAVEDATHVYQKRTNHANVSTAKIKAISDAYEAILAEAVSGAADASVADPTALHYAEIGVIGADTADVVAFLADAIRYKNIAQIDTVAEVQALLDTISAVHRAASAGSEPSAAQLLGLGVTGVTPDNHANVQRVLAAAISQGHVFTTVSDLQTLVTQGVNEYNAALQVIENYALESSAAPQLNNYTALGLSNVTVDNLAAVNSAIKAQDSVETINTATKVEALVSTYNTLLTEVSSATPNDANAVTLTATQYEAIGADIGAAADAQNANNLALINDVMLTQQVVNVDTVAEVSALALVANTIQAIATDQVTAPLLTVDDFNRIGLSGVHEGNLEFLLALIAAQPNNGSSTNSVKKLQTLVGSMYSAALQVIENYVTGQAESPQLKDYAVLGLTEVTSENLNAINSAIKAQGSVDAIDSTSKVQAVVTTYNTLLQEVSTGPASGGVNLTAAQYDLIGANIGNAASPDHTNNLTLLNDLLGAQSAQSAQTIAEVNALATIANAIQQIAAQGTANTSLHVDDLVNIGLQGVRSDNLDALIASISQQHQDGSATNTLEKLQALVYAINDAPVFQPGTAWAFADMAEDSPAPVGAVGLDVSGLNLDITDADGPSALKGIAITSVNPLGTLHFSLDNGATWQAASSIDPAHALLLGAEPGTRIYFQPNADRFGVLSEAVSFHAWDQSTGSVGSYGDARTVGAISAYSTAQGVLTLTISAVNDVPTLRVSDPARIAFVEGGSDAETTQGASVGLFTSAQINVGGTGGFESNQSIQGFTLQATGLQDGVNETLQLDGEWISLGSAIRGVTSTHGLKYQVSVEGALTTLTVECSQDLSAAEAEGLITALRYQNTNVDNPHTSTPRQFEITTLTDSEGGMAHLVHQEAQVTVKAVNDRPTITQTSLPTLGFTENGAAVSLLSSDFTISDVDDNNLSTASITITHRLADGTDKLIFNDTSTMGGNFDAAHGVLTLQALAGQASRADFEAALKSVKYQSTSENPTELLAQGNTPNDTRSFQVSVTDAGGGRGVDTKTSNLLNFDLHITGVEDKPVITLNADANLLNADLPAWGTPYEADALKQVDSGLRITDADSTALWGCYIRIANWNWGEDAFVLDLQDPITHQLRPVLFDVRGAVDLQDALAMLNAKIDQMAFMDGWLNAPRGSGNTPLTGVRYAAQGEAYGYAPLDSAYLQNDGADHYLVTKSFLELRFGYAVNLDANNNYVADISSISDFAKDLASLRLGSTEAQSARPVEFTVTDVKKDAGYLVPGQIDALAGDMGISRDEYIFRNFTGSGSAGTREIASGYSSNAAPIITLDANGPLRWTEGSPEIHFNKIVDITDLDQLTPGSSDQIKHATITVSNALASDELTFNGGPFNLTPAGPALYSEANHTWTLMFDGVDTLANYKEAINAITWRNTSEDPTAGGACMTRTVRVVITDNFDNLSAQSQATGATEFIIDVTSVNDAPVVLGLGQFENAAQEQTAFNWANVFRVDDVDLGSGSLTLTLTAAHSSEDRLHVVVGDSGATLLSGGDGTSHDAVVSGSLAQLNALLAGEGTATLRYQNVADMPQSQTSISVVASDGDMRSAVVSERLTVNSINDAPVLADAPLVLRNVDVTAPRGSVGVAVTTLLGGVSDVDGPVARQGIAVIAANDNGQLYYSTDNGLNWVIASDLRDSHALLLSADPGVRVYFSATGYLGSTTEEAIILNDAITIRAWDQTSGTPADYANASITGGSSAFSSATDTVQLRIPAAPKFTAITDHVGPITTAIVSGTYTDDTKPTFTGIAEVGTTVKLYNNGLWLGQAQANSLSGVWSFTPSVALSSGAHTITGTVVDGSGNLGISSAEITFTVDTISPVAVLDTQAGTEDSSSLSGHVDINDTGKDGTEIYSLLSNAAGTYGGLVFDASGGYTYSRNAINLNTITTSVSDSFNYQVVDAAGHKSTSTLTITLSPANDAPVLTHTTLNLVGIGLGKPNGVAGTTVASLMAGVSDADGSALPKGVAIVGANPNGTLYYSTDAGATWAMATDLSETHALLLKSESRSRIYFQFNTGRVADLTDAITFRAWDETAGAEASYVSIDARGGTSAFSSATDSAALHLPAAPQITLMADDVGAVTGAIAFGGATDDLRPAFSGTAEIGSTVKLYNNGVLMAQVVASSPLGAWSFTPGVDFTAGTHIITATATNAQGNTGLTCDPVSVTIDTVAPKAVADNQVVTEDVTVLTGNVGTNDTNLDGRETFTLLGTGRGSYGNVVMSPDGSYTYTHNTTNLDAIATAVTDFFSYRVTDAAGNSSQSSLYVKINPANDAPLLDSTKYLALPDVLVTNFPVGAVGALVSSLVIGVTDPDGASATKGIAITGVNSNGVLCYSQDGGTTWYTAYGVNDTQALRLVADADNRIYFKPSAGFTGMLSDAFTLRAWDNADRSVDGSTGSVAVNGGTSTYSTATDTVSVKIFPLSSSFTYAANFDNPIDPLSGASWVLGSNTSAYINDFDGVASDKEFAFVNGKSSQDLIALKDQTLGKNQHITTFTFDADLDIHSAGDDFFVNFCPATQSTVNAPASGFRFQMTDSGSLTVSPSLSVYLNGVLLQGTLTSVKNPLATRASEHLRIDVTADGTVTMVENLQNGTENTLVVKSTPLKTAWTTVDMTGWTFEYGGRSGANSTGIGWIDDVVINATAKSTQLPVTPTLVSTDDVGTTVGVMDAYAVTNDSRPTFTGLADPLATIKVYDGTLFLGSTTANSLTGLWSYTPVNPLSNGAHTINVKAIDSAGNFSALASNTFTVDSGLTAPVVLDLNRDGVLSYSQLALDVNGDSRPEATAWVAAPDGVLVWDRYADGQVHNNSQYAFTQYGGQTDLAGLAAGFDTNQDGVFDAQDAKFAEFAVWQDINQNGVSDAGEVQDLSHLGIASLALISDGVQRNPSAGVLESGRTTATLTDGSLLRVADAAFVYQSTAAPHDVKDKLTLQDVLQTPPSLGVASTVDITPHDSALAFSLQWLIDQSTQATTL